MPKLRPLVLTASAYQVKGLTFPPLLTICGKTWHLTFAKKLSHGDMGYCDPKTRLICISLDQPKNELIATVWHEILHAFEFELRLTLGHPKIRKLEYALAEIAKQLPSA